jgi:hypothetical protein
MMRFAKFQFVKVRSVSQKGVSAAPFRVLGQKADDVTLHSAGHDVLFRR